MINKIFTLSLGFLIVLSTSGVPFTIHLCEKVGLVLVDKCQICEEKREIEKSCCNSSSSKYLNSFFVNYNKDCCQSKLVENKIDDKFLSVKNEQEIVSKKQNHLIIISLFPSQVTSFEKRLSYLGLSPPVYKKIDLNILLSTFLI